MNIKEIINPLKNPTFLGYTIGQTPLSYLVFPKFFEKEKFDIVLEIGTWNGVFSMFLAFCCFVNDTEFKTIDYKVFNNSKIYEIIKLLNGEFYKMDVYSSNGIKFIKDILQSKKRVLFLCDGAIKKKCINFFSKYLKVNDVIMGHDYFKTKSRFKKQNKWRSCELVDDDIKEVCEQYNLEVIYEDIFNEIFWTCRIKKCEK